MYNNILAEGMEYVRRSRLESLVIGISGGIDSALVAALARVICDETGITLIGRSMPIVTNKPDEIARASAIGKCFCDDFETVSLDDVYNNLYKSISNPARHDITTKAERIRRGNVKARTRMILLYDLAHLNNGLVLSTDNYTELLLGFWTMHGDVGDYGMIQNLWKTEVYGLAAWLCKKYAMNDAVDKAEALNACITAVPTDGLGVTDSDFDQLGLRRYTDIDNVLLKYITDGVEEDDSPVVLRYKNTHYKRNNPINLTRNKILGIM
ncbi:MAG TPA: NAD(+) synthase [Patescibacteria group bacterium]|nr:NAD(+) synthase [Patescibacteria group bacterium]